MNVLKIKTEYIKLDQALKYSGLCESGAFAKDIILSGSVTVNGKVETRRGKKLYSGDVFKLDGEEFLIKGES